MKPQETQNTGDELKQIIVGLFSKITEHQTPNGPIRGIGSNRIGLFNLTECEMIRQRIISIQNESETGRKTKTLSPGKVLSYEKGRRIILRRTGCKILPQNFYGRLRRKPTDLHWSRV